MSSDDQRRETLFIAVGEALFLAQILELHLSVLVSILDKHFHTRVDIDGLIHCRENSTLGQLIRSVLKRGKMDETGISILHEALQARNYLAHHFYYKNIYAFSDDLVHRAALERLAAATKQIAKGTALAIGFANGFRKTLENESILIEQEGVSEP